MAISRRQKVCICLFALAVAALMIDRVVLSPADTGPDQALVDQASPPSGRPAAPADKPAKPRCPSLVTRLKALSEADGTDVSPGRDAFAMPEALLTEMLPARSARPAQSETTTPESDYRLMAVMVDTNGGYAIIDGKCLLVGQEVNGLKLISVAEDSAIVEANGVRTELRLQGKTWSSENW